MNRATRPSRPGLTGSASKSLLLSAAAGGVVLKAAPDTTTSTSLTWTEPEYKPDNYRVERSLDGTTFSTVTTLANTVFDYNDTGRTESTQYWYRIVPILGGVDQLASNVADTWTVPATPTSLTATAVSSSVIDLAWSDVSTGNLGYVIEARRPPTTGTYGVIGTAGATATTFSATLLQASTAYEFRVAATNPATQSAYSNEATATTNSATVPNAPTGVSASASTTAVAVTITWTDASTDEDNFNVYRNTSNTTVGATLLNSPLAGIQTYTDNATNNPSAPPAIGTTYYYWVSASNGAGESAKTAASQNATGGVTTLNVPAAPTSLTTTGVSTTQINLSWVDNATNETSYIVERRSPAGTGSYSQITSLAAGSTTFNNTGLSESVQYEYRVAAVNAAGNSAYSNASSKFTIPATPTGLTATATSSTQINLAWSDVSTGNTGQRIERRSPAGTGSYSTLTTVSATATTYSDTGLTASTQYEYRIIATNADYDSSPSTAASATTNAAAGSTLEYLVVGGGGGGSTSGGGGGGYRTATGFSITAGTSYTVTVGAGGGRGTPNASDAAKGSDSVFSTITSDGGGKGVRDNVAAGGDGGSGGGGAASSSSSAGGLGTSGQGNNGGGNGGFVASPYPSGGGGGASAAGGTATANNVSGAGGAGTASSITGTSVTRAGGGGGGVYFATGSPSPGAGGAGGGGAGASGTGTAGNGTANTGGGGGGSGFAGSAGTPGNGGSGVVILRMASSTYSGLQTGSPTVSTSGSDTILTYNASGTYTGGDSSTYYAEYLVVAGGGGGGTPGGAGGGGAGGYRTATGFSLTTGTSYTITVGAGGAAGANGSNSVFSTITSDGGGAGGAINTAGANGGSGGGGGADGGVSRAGGTATSGQGNNGGATGSTSIPYASGGGGGAGSAGGSATGAGSGSVGGSGGNGSASTITGTSVTRAGGGGGGTTSAQAGATAGAGGTGGGGAGSLRDAAATAGTVNTGGGGGGSGGGTGTAGAGGSGVVIIRVPAARYSGTTTGSPTVTDDGQFKVLTFNASGSYTA